MTTYGVGELSAINALAGAYAERVPIVQIAGTPSRLAMVKQTPGRPVHHTIPDRGMDVYSKMADHVVCKKAHLHSAPDGVAAAKMYDGALSIAIDRSKPVYVTLANDMIDMPVPAKNAG